MRSPDANGSASDAGALETEFKGQLSLPGPQGRVVDHAEVGIADGGIRGAKHRAVESVLGLQAQLQFHGFVFVGEDEIFAD